MKMLFKIKQNEQQIIQFGKPKNENCKNEKMRLVQNVPKAKNKSIKM